MNKLQYGSVPLVVFLLVAQLADMCWCESKECFNDCNNVTLTCEEGKVLKGIVVRADCKCSDCQQRMLKQVMLKEGTSCESQKTCTITTSSVNCPGKKFEVDFEVEYECSDKDKSDISEQGDDSGGVDDKSNAGVGLIVALVVCGLVIVVLLSIIGVFLYRRHRYKRSLVKKRDSVIGSLRLDTSNHSPSRDSSTYRRLPDSLTRQDSTYNSIPFDTDRTYSYAGLNSAEERDSESQIAGDKQAGSQIQNDGYTTLLKSDKPPVLPDRSNSEGSDYNDISDSKHVSAGDNTYSHGPSGNVEYDRIVRYPQPTLDENYTHFKCDANGTDSIRNDRVDVDQTSNGAQENNPNGPSNDSSRVILPIAVKGDASDSDVDDEQEDPTESKNTNDGYEDWVPGTAQDTAGDDDIGAHMNTGGEIHTDGPATLEIESDYVIQRSDMVDTKDTNKLNKERDTQAQKPFMKRVDSYEHPETFVGV